MSLPNDAAVSNCTPDLGTVFTPNSTFQTPDISKEIQSENKGNESDSSASKMDPTAGIDVTSPVASNTPQGRYKLRPRLVKLFAALSELNQKLLPTSFHGYHGTRGALDQKE